MYARQTSGKRLRVDEAHGDAAVGQTLGMHVYALIHRASLMN